MTGTCTAPAGAKFFAHRRRTRTVTRPSADVNFVSGGTTTNIVHTTDWQNPDVGRRGRRRTFLAVQAGDSFTYSCAYSNPGDVSR